MRLFYGPASPYARMVRIALLETGLDELVRKQEVTLRDPGSALLPFNPVGRVPTLELENGTILTESLLILTYLDTQHAGAPLLPKDGSDRWRTLAEVGTATGMLEGIVTWSRELRRHVNERSSGVIALETTRVTGTPAFGFSVLPPCNGPATTIIFAIYSSATAFYELSNRGLAQISSDANSDGSPNQNGAPWTLRDGVSTLFQTQKKIKKRGTECQMRRC